MNPIQGNDEWGGYELVPEGIFLLNPPAYYEQIEQDARLRLYNYIRQVAFTHNINPIQLRQIVGYKVYTENQTVARIQEMYLNDGYFDYIVNIVNNEMQGEGVVLQFDVEPAAVFPRESPTELIHNESGPNTPPPPIV
jgi:hypothetical protein